MYFNDLVITVESLEELDIWYAAWKHFMDCKRLRVNLAKIKLMISEVKPRTNFYLRKTPMWSML